MGIVVMNVLLLMVLLAGDLGQALIVLSILIRLIVFRVNIAQLKSSRALQKFDGDNDWQRIQKKYKHDQEKMAQERMRLYKARGINPFAGCLPALIQIPILLGLYLGLKQALASSPLQLAYQQEHIYAPLAGVKALLPLDSRFLWMDLGQPERLNIPGIGFGIPVLAVLVVTMSFLHARLSQPVASVSAPTAIIDQTLAYVMPVAMGLMALTLASGLSLYILTSDLIGIILAAAMGNVRWRRLLLGADWAAKLEDHINPEEPAVTKPGK